MTTACETKRLVGKRRVGSVAAPLVALFLSFALPVAPRAHAAIQVDCDSEDDFCTGDPCVTAEKIEVTVASCVLDFGSRALVLAQALSIPSGGALSLTAGSIDVRRRIKGRHTQTGAGNGANVSLIASGDILVRKPIDVSAKVTNGSILIDAGGNVELRRGLRARGTGKAATATGGTVTVNADGSMSSKPLGKIDARGRSKHTSGGQVSIDAVAGADLEGQIDVRGSAGGSIAVTSSAGSISLGQKIRAEGKSSGGGSIAMQAQGDINAGLKARIEADGQVGTPGVVTFTAAGTIDVRTLSARGLGDGGSISIFAGTVSARNLYAKGRDQGGLIVVESTVGDLFVRRLDVTGAHDVGGSAIATSAADLAFVGLGRAEGDPGGEMRFSATGDMLLDGGSFDVRDGGTIEGIAGGDLTARGKFRAEVGGCVGLSAGGTLDTNSAVVDVPLLGSCP